MMRERPHLLDPHRRPLEELHPDGPDRWRRRVGLGGRGGCGVLVYHRLGRAGGEVHLLATGWRKKVRSERGTRDG